MIRLATPGTFGIVVLEVMVCSKVEKIIIL